MKSAEEYTNRIKGHALVLGGSGGIGREVVLALAANGASAISFTYGRNKTAAEKVAQELARMGVNKTCFVPLAIPKTDADVPAFERALEDIVTVIGEEISVAVNTIGISPNQPHEEQTIEGEGGWRDVYETNVFGSFLTMRAIAKRMKEKGVKDGSIVLITSTNGINSQAEFSAHYDSSKAAQAHKMKTLAEKFIEKYGVRVNSIAPGWVATPMNDTVPKDELQKEIDKVWLKRMAEPAEIAKVVAFVAGTGGSYIVGQNIMVDGGYR